MSDALLRTLMTICTLGKDARSGPTRPRSQSTSILDRGGVALELQGALRVGDVAGGRARGAGRHSAANGAGLGGGIDTDR